MPSQIKNSNIKFFKFNQIKSLFDIGNWKFVIPLIVFFGIFGVAEKSWAAEHYVREGAMGANDGSNWTDAWIVLPATLARGDTYYIADGNYSAYTVDDAENGTQYITIKKATTVAHGTNTGWADGYGDGQAIFAFPFNITRSYVTFDGVVGEGASGGTEGNGFDPDTYGFKIVPPSNCWDILNAWTPATGSRTGSITGLIENMITDSSQNFTAGNLANKKVCITHDSLYKCYQIRGGNDTNTIPVATCNTIIADGFQVGDSYELKSGDFYGIGAPPTGITRNLSDIQILHTAVVGCGENYKAIAQYGLYGVAYPSYSLTNMIYANNYLANTGTNIMTRDWSGNIFNNYLDNQHTGCDYELHGQQMSTGGDNVNLYNNIFRKSCVYVLATHAMSANWNIYNNLVLDNYPGCAIDSIWAGTPGTGETDYMKNYKIYHNTHVNVNIGGRGVVYIGELTNPEADKAYFYNNLFYSSTGVGFTNYLSPPENIAHQYNAYYSSTGTFGDENGTAIDFDGDPFVNFAGGNYQLKAESLSIDAGISLASPFDVDYLGVTRPQGVAWDIGAYEYVGVDVVAPAAPSGLAVN